ncbi:YopT-type cysteine protease domain-containing protein [Shewanella baltica]|uniref:YopT-type cysteine protease domain-containing protein n=1 Tax=Shewanella baltica TaxID=62322 RepID=UPI00325F50E3
MSIIPISIRSNLGLSISSSELSKLQNIDVKSINNVDIARLDKTLSVTKTPVKRGKIISLKEKISDAKYGLIFDVKREGIKNEVLILSTKGITKSVLKALNIDKQLVSIIHSTNDKTICQSAIIRDFQLVGVKLTTLPNNYRELFTFIRARISDNSVVDGIFKKYENRGQLDEALKPNATKKILSILFSLPQNQQLLANHFSGCLNVTWDQSSLLKNIQVGKDGLCSTLAMKWCADKHQGVHFFNDMDTKEGLEEVVNLKINKEVVSYLQSRGLAVTENETKLNINKAGFHLLGLSPKKKGYGHEVAAFIDDQAKQYKYFDPNLGEFSFPTSEKMKSFIKTSSTRIYTDLKLDHDLILTPV